MDLFAGPEIVVVVSLSLVHAAQTTTVSVLKIWATELKKKNLFTSEDPAP